MIKDLLEKTNLDTLLAAWRKLVAAARAALAAHDPEAAAHGWTEADLAALDGLLDAALKAVRAEEPTGAFITSSADLSFVQTVFESAYTRAGMVDEPAGHGLAAGTDPGAVFSLKPEAYFSDGQALFGGIFDDPNPLYLTTALRAMAWRATRGKHDFSTSPVTFPLASRARIVLVGDWGTGIPRAQTISALMRTALMEADGRERHAIHLGDIYFCGWPEEARNRFLRHWPVRPGEPIHSWCLNGNHDMYSGGAGYFKAVLGDDRFAAQGGCSYFLLENDAWQIAGLDSAYEEWSLSYGQAVWLERQRHREPGKKALLLSHHQVVSAYENEPGMTALAGDLRKPLLEKSIDAWIWGHEHRCVAYKDRPIRFADGLEAVLPFGCCLGNGGVPAHPTPPGGDGVICAVTEFLMQGFERFGLFGFGILDLDGTSAKLTLVDEHNRKVLKDYPLA